MTARRRVAYDPTRHRLREIECVIRARHGVVPDTDDADLYLVPIAQALRRICERRKGEASTADVLDRLQVWAQRFAPTIDAHRLEHTARTAMRREIDKADVIAAKLRVSYAERQRLRLRTIGAVDVNKAGRKRRAAERRRERDRERVRAKRLAAGKIERAVYLARSLSAARPWEAEGVSRRTWYRRRKAAQATRGTGVSPHRDLHAGRHTCANGTARGRGDAERAFRTNVGIDAAAYGSDGVVARVRTELVLDALQGERVAAS